MSLLDGQQIALDIKNKVQGGVVDAPQPREPIEKKGPLFSIRPENAEDFFSNPNLTSRDADRAALEWMDVYKKTSKAGVKSASSLTGRLGSAIRSHKQWTDRHPFLEPLSNAPEIRVNQRAQKFDENLNSWNQLYGNREDFEGELKNRGMLDYFEKHVNRGADPEKLQGNMARAILVKDMAGKSGELYQANVARNVLDIDSSDSESFDAGVRTFLETKIRNQEEVKMAWAEGIALFMRDPKGAGFDEAIDKQPSAKAIEKFHEAYRSLNSEFQPHLLAARSLIRKVQEDEGIEENDAGEYNVNDVINLYRKEGGREEFLYILGRAIKLEGVTIEDVAGQMSKSLKMGVDNFDITMNQLARRKALEKLKDELWKKGDPLPKYEWNNPPKKESDRLESLDNQDPFRQSKEETTKGDDELRKNKIETYRNYQARYRLHEDLRDLSNRVNRVNPIGMTEKALSLSTQSLPYMALMSSPAGMALAVASVREDSFNELMQQDPSMNEDNAWAVASVVSPIEVAIEKLKFGVLTGKFPGLTTVMNKMVGGGVIKQTLSALTKMGVVSGIEYAQETVQEATQPLVQDIVSALESDVPEGDWDHFRVMDLDRLLAVLPLSILSGGGQHIRAKFQFEEMSKVFQNEAAMRISGGTVAEVETIAEVAKVDPDRARAMYKETVESKSIEERNEIGDAAADEIFHEGLAEGMEGLPTVTTTRDGKIKIDFNDGRVDVVDSYGEVQTKVDKWMREESVSNVKAVNEFIESIQERVDGDNTVERVERISLKDILAKGQQSEESLKRSVAVYYAQQGLPVPKNIDLANYYEDGSVTLKRKMAGFAVRLSKSANPLTVAEEFAEGFIGMVVGRGEVTFDEVKGLLDEFGSMAGIDMTAGYKGDPNRAVIEGFSRFAKAYLLQGKYDSLPESAQDWMNKAWRIMENPDSMPNKLRAVVDFFVNLLKSVFEVSKAIEFARRDGDGLNPDLESLAQRALGLDEKAVVERMREKAQQEILDDLFDPSEELSAQVKGKLQHPADLDDDPLQGEVQGIWESMSKEINRKRKDGRRVISDAKARDFFAKKGQGEDLDDLRRNLNEEGFRFDTPSDMLGAIQDSVEGEKVWPVGMGEETTYSITPAQASFVEPGFYSQLESVIDAKMGKTATVSQIIGMLNPAKGSGVKAEEMKWSGIEVALPELAKDGKVSKAELLDYLRTQGRVKFEVVDTKSAGDLEGYSVTLEDESEGLWVLQREDGEEMTVIMPYGSTQDQAEDAFREKIDRVETQYSDHQLPGGKNYREVVLAMQEPKDALKERNGSYTSSHFSSIPNYVAHMRLNDREDGLFIEEIQSDRHQAGRKKGYKGRRPNPTDAEVVKYFGLVDGADPADFRDEMVDILVDKNDLIADAPHRKDWALAMFKRALRSAVDSGKSWIGWTTGETQNERYDLSKQVGEIKHWKSSEDGLYGVQIFEPGGETIMHEDEAISVDALADLIGKDVTQKIVDREGDDVGNDALSLSGDNLKIGGSGMKGFYDQILPNEVQDYVKKWGAKVENVDLEIMGTNGETGEKSRIPLTEIWRVDITPKMKAGVEAGQTTFSITPADQVENAEDAITRLFSGPSEIIETGQKMRAKLKKIRESFEGRMFGSKFSDADTREIETINALIRINAIASVLPKEIRSVVGSPVDLVKLKSQEAKERNVIKRLEKISMALDNYVRDAAIVKIDKIFKDNAPKKRGSAKVKTGNIGVEGHEELNKIEAVVDMTDEEVGDAAMTLEIDMANAYNINEDSDRDDKIMEIDNSIARLSTFGKIKSKEEPMSVDGVEKSLTALESMVKNGKMHYQNHQLLERERIAEIRRKTIEVVTGGNSRKGSPERLESMDMTSFRKKSVSWMKDQHGKNISAEFMLNALSRHDSSSETLGSYLNTHFGESIHKATHDESQAVTKKRLEFFRFIADSYGINTDKIKWQNKIEDVIIELGKRHKKSGIFRYEQSGKRVFKTYRAEAEAIAAGQINYVHDGYGFIELNAAEIADIRKQLTEDAKATKKDGSAKPPKQNFKIEREIEGNKVEQALSHDVAMFLTMMYGQVGLRPAMERHGYTAELMGQMEDFLPAKAKRLRFWLFRKYDQNHAYFSATFEKMFGVPLGDVENYSPAKSIHAGRHVKDMIDSSGGKKSTTPGMAMDRIKHMAEPRYDVGAISTYMQHIEETEHFVHWGRLIKDMRSVFMDKEVRENILDYHGDEIYSTFLKRIDMLADAGNVNAEPQQFLDHLRKTFTVVKLSFKWGIFLKQLTSLPAYSFDMPTDQFLKYEAEFFASFIKNTKFMMNLPYVKQRWGEGYDRDVMAVMNSMKAKKKGSLARAAEAGMITGRLGDILPVIAGGYAVYKYRKAKALDDDMSEPEAEAFGILQFEMSTDRAQQSGNIKDQSHFSLGGSLNRVLTMFQTSPRQYYANMYEALADAQLLTKGGGRKGSRKRLAKMAFISHVVLPSSFYWMSWFTRNLPRDDEDKEDASEMLKGWAAAMALGPLSGLYMWGQIGSSFISGYEYGLPVMEWSDSAKDAKNNLFKMWDGHFSEDDAKSITPDDIMELLDDVATSASLSIGGGAMWYDIGKNFASSVGFTKDDVKELMMNDEETGVFEASKIRKNIYEEPIDKDDPDKKEKTKARYQELAKAYDEYAKTYPARWLAIRETLIDKGKLPEAVRSWMENDNP